MFWGFQCLTKMSLLTLFIDGLCMILFFFSCLVDQVDPLVQGSLVFVVSASNTLNKFGDLLLAFIY